MNETVDAASAAARTDDHILERHRAFLAVVRERPMDLLFSAIRSRADGRKSPTSGSGTSAGCAPRTSAWAAMRPRT
jgi:hypothetical protein